MFKEYFQLVRIPGIFTAFSNVLIGYFFSLSHSPESNSLRARESPGSCRSGGTLHRCRPWDRVGGPRCSRRMRPQSRAWVLVDCLIPQVTSTSVAVIGVQPLGSLESPKSKVDSIRSRTALTARWPRFWYSNCCSSSSASHHCSPCWKSSYTCAHSCCISMLWL